MLIFPHDGRFSKVFSLVSFWLEVQRQEDKHDHENESARQVYGSGGFGNINSVMREICSGTWITFITILSNMGSSRRLTIGRGRHIIVITGKDGTVTLRRL